MTTELTAVQLENRKAEWIASAQKLQERGQELSLELGSLQQQLAQLNGAIQACDVLLQDAQAAGSPAETSTLTE